MVFWRQPSFSRECSMKSPPLLESEREALEAFRDEIDRRIASRP
ncbi:Hypothetical protein CAP_8232 [Chondromyces apiculatus DSM 436]|uniref:Uncharacterized protein n=1 Tax=Chondromyces apiculatus DSM 436 TaxID=1192034 RepID=A0A017TGK5_9BACT|nr:Hypothetical protein CAP_8232 [Chondromyces apiculatus DSM 436]